MPHRTSGRWRTTERQLHSSFAGGALVLRVVASRNPVPSDDNGEDSLSFGLHSRRAALTAGMTKRDPALRNPSLINVNFIVVFLSYHSPTGTRFKQGVVVPVPLLSAALLATPGSSYAVSNSRRAVSLPKSA